MDAQVNLFSTLRRGALPAVCILLIAYFVSHAITGPSGALAWKDYHRQRAGLEAQAAMIAEQKAALARQIKLLDPAGVDPDLADELVRQNLNVIKPDEVIVTLEPVG